jgi:hypothetical protein
MFADQPTGLGRPALNLGIAQPTYPPPLGRIEGRMVAGWDGGGAHDAPVRSASLVLAPLEVLRSDTCPGETVQNEPLQINRK